LKGHDVRGLRRHLAHVGRLAWSAEVELLLREPQLSVQDLAFSRSYVLVTPAYGEATGEVRELVARIRDHIRIWLR
jgi:hypothetical protein